MDSYQIFRLIDSILPFEACLYHQVLPIAIEGSRLRLGMVDPDDLTALNYVRQLLAYVNCSLIPQPISAEAHKSMLSAYLNYTDKSKNSPGENNYNTSKLTKNEVDRPLKPPPEKDTSKPNTEENNHASNLIKNEVDRPLKPPAENNISQTKSDNISAIQPTVNTEEEKIKSAIQDIINSLPVLEVKTDHVSSPMEVLATLPPPQLLKELLGRVVTGGIGRLHFERHPEQGRILWSQNGVLQSVLENLPLNVFQCVINELKILTHLPLIPIQNPKQVELARRYQESEILVRLRIMIGNHGEEATLQVLRGAALKFYQQQYLENISRDALRHAQQLYHKIKEMRDRSLRYPYLNISQLEVLPALQQLIQGVNQNMNDIKALPASDTSKKN